MIVLSYIISSIPEGSKFFEDLISKLTHKCGPRCQRIIDAHDGREKRITCRHQYQHQSSQSKYHDDYSSNMHVDACAILQRLNASQTTIKGRWYYTSSTTSRRIIPHIPEKALIYNSSTNVMVCDGGAAEQSYLSRYQMKSEQLPTINPRTGKIYDITEDNQRTNNNEKNYTESRYTILEKYELFQLELLDNP